MDYFEMYFEEPNPYEVPMKTTLSSDNVEMVRRMNKFVKTDSVQNPKMGKDEDDK